MSLCQAESVVGPYPYLKHQVQHKLSSSSLHDELAVSDNFIPEQYSVDTLAPRLLDTGNIYWNAMDNTLHYDIWWLTSARSWRRIKVTAFLVRNGFRPLALRRREDILSQLRHGTRGGIPLMNFLLDHCLADQDLSGWKTDINIVPSSTGGSLDVLGLDFLSGRSFSIKDESEDVDGELARRTQDVLAMECHAYREKDIAMEARLSGLFSKVRFRGAGCAQTHMPFQDMVSNPDAQKYFFLEIEAFRKLQGGARISKFVGVILDDSE